MLSLCVCVKLCVCVCYVCYVKFVCVKLLSVKFVYVKFVCSVCGGGREEEEEKEEPGIQNQKQEPHTKMWGKTYHLQPLAFEGYFITTGLMKE